MHTVSRTKKLLLLIITIIFSLCVTSCEQNDKNSDNEGLNSETGTQNNIQASEKFSGFDTEVAYDELSASVITLGDGESTVKGDGVYSKDDLIVVNKGGVYIFRGKLTNGRIVVSVDKTEKVRLVFDGVTVSCKDSAPVYIESADKVVITLAKDSVNTFSDGTDYNTESVQKKINACIFSEDDLSVNGYGKLIINGNFNNGIGCENDLKLVSGEIEVTAVNNGVKGKDSVLINTGNININAGKDGIKSDETDDVAKGIILIEGGNIFVTAGDDALQAENSIVISGGMVTVSSEGKAYNCKNENGLVDIKNGCLTEK